MLRRLKEKHLVGVEHVPLVFKLALMNMILHRDGSSLLANDDSLSNKAQDVHKGMYDLILANPPFGPTKQERMAQFEFHIKMYEALFIQHMMNSLRPGGRAAVVSRKDCSLIPRRCSGRSAGGWSSSSRCSGLSVCLTAFSTRTAVRKPASSFFAALWS